MTGKLTIVILTYNRRERLLKQLHSIYAQAESKDIQIIINDNCSNYDVLAAIIEEFGAERVPNLKVYSNPVNFGMHANLAMPFLKCETEWLWTLSDDDETSPGSIAMILDDIKKYPDTAVFKYQINENYTKEDVVFDTFESLIDYYYSGKSNGGQLIFLSNNVYNNALARKYYSSTLSYSYCCIAQMLPMFYILDNRSGVVRLRKDVVCEFKKPDPHSTYPYLRTAVEISSTNLLDFNLNNKYYSRLGFVVTSGFSHYRLAMSALEYKDRRRGYFLYKQVYSRAYKNSGKCIDKLYYMLFMFCYIFHLHLPYEVALRFRTWMRKFFPNFR